MAKEKSLLEEAIAEAKRVREAAIADATKRLEENLTPSIKEMLASKLEEELNLDEEMEEEDLNENSNSGFKEVKLKEAEDDNAEEEPKDDEEEAPAEDAPADEAPAEDAEDAPADEDPAAEGDPAAEEENDDDTPLKDITLGDLRTLIQDIVAAGQAPAEGGDLGADMDAGGVEGMGDEEPAGDLAADAAPEGEIEPAGAAADDLQDPNATDDVDDDEEDIDISEILKELEEEEKASKKCPKCGKDVENCICKENKANDVMPEDQTGKEHCKPANADSGKDQDQEINELKKENEELKEGLAKMTKTLKDVNLLNSKLIYTTRILNRKGLAESQKVKAMQSLDEAKTPREVKTIYKTIAEGLNKTTIKEGRQASRASRAAGKSTASNVIVESNDMVRRFQQLAGIIKD